jgi:isochorismate hydrolase
MDIHAESTVMLVIDFQEKLAKAMDSQKIQEVTMNTVKLVKSFKILNVPVLYTQQYTKGLGETLSLLKDLLPPHYIEKTTFSCYREPTFVESITKLNRKHIVICGMEAHICVLQSAIDLMSNNYTVTVVSDATISRSHKNHEEAMSFLRCRGAYILPYESIIFMLLQDAKNPLFKEISSLIK